MWQRIREFFSGLFASSDDDDGKPPRVESVPPGNAPISGFFADVAADNTLFGQFVTNYVDTINHYSKLTAADKNFLITAIGQGQPGYEKVRGRLKQEASSDSAMVWICIWIHQTPNPPPHSGPGTGPSPGDG